VRLGKAFGKATAIEGCSVGPFDEHVYDHARNILRTLDLICARDVLSYEYMLAMGLTNVKLVADPAFRLPAEEVPGLDLPRDAPVVGFGASHGFPIYLGISGKEYVQKSAGLIAEILERTDARVALLPHVFYRDSREDDYQVCEEIVRAIGGSERVWMPGHRGLNAKQLKYVTGLCSMVVGARMHAIIAAISQGIPSVVFTYSVKSKGLFQQVYGHQDYVLDYASISDGRAHKVILDVYLRRQEICAAMAPGVALMKERSMMNGQYVVDMLRRCSKSALRKPIA
jgi:polysaccharide pyruvyl transferase WcaK-like protein